ncbi:MAG: PAS domain-containing protein [Thermomicrobiales bacterium]
MHYLPNRAVRLQRQIEQVFVSRDTVIDETPFVTSSVALAPYQYIFCPVLDAVGGVERLAGSMRDVTERRRAQEQSRQILESITDAFFSLDDDWRFTYLNRHAERLLESAPGALIGRLIREQVPEPSAASSSARTAGPRTSGFLRRSPPTIPTTNSGTRRRSAPRSRGSRSIFATSPSARIPRICSGQAKSGCGPSTAAPSNTLRPAVAARHAAGRESRVARIRRGDAGKAVG